MAGLIPVSLAAEENRFMFLSLFYSFLYFTVVQEGYTGGLQRFTVVWGFTIVFGGHTGVFTEDYCCLRVYYCSVYRCRGVYCCLEDT